MSCNKSNLKETSSSSTIPNSVVEAFLIKPNETNSHKKERNHNSDKEERSPNSRKNLNKTKSNPQKEKNKSQNEQKISSEAREADGCGRSSNRVVIYDICRC